MDVGLDFPILGSKDCIFDRDGDPRWLLKVKDRDDEF